MSSIEEKIIQQQEWFSKNSTRDMFLSHVRNYQQVTGIEAKTLGWKAAGDSSLIERLNNGKSITIDKLDAVLCYMELSLTPVQLKMYQQLNQSN